MACTSTGSGVRTLESAAHISTPVTRHRTATTARMKPWRGAVSNNNNNDNNNKNKGDFYNAHLPHEVGAQGQCMHRVWGLPDVMHRKHYIRARFCVEVFLCAIYKFSFIHSIFTRECCMVPVAHRIHTCLPIRNLRQAFEDAGSVSCCCFVC